MTTIFSHTLLALAVMGCSFGSTANAQTPAPNPSNAVEQKPKPAPRVKSEAELIEERLRSADAAVRAAAVEEIKVIAVERPGMLADNFPKRWAPALMQNEMDAEVESLALVALLAKPGDLMVVSDAQRVRTSAAMAQGRHDEALSLAKGLYNVTSLRGTEGAIDLVSECLAGARAKDEPRVVRRFKRQQVAGASPPVTGALPATMSVTPTVSATPTTEPSMMADSTPTSAPTMSVEDDLGENILKSIQVDPTPYEQALHRLSNSTSFRDLMARGNLLLLSDRASEALVCFELAYDLAKDKDLIVATEAIARAIRAQDGVVGRANAYIVSLQNP